MKKKHIDFRISLHISNDPNEDYINESEEADDSEYINDDVATT